MEAYLERKEPTAEEIDTVAQHEEVPKKMPQHWRTNMGPRRIWQPPTDGRPAVLYLHGIRDIIRDKAGTVARGTPKGQTFRKIHWA
jgi:hypothetical protein